MSFLQRSTTTLLKTSFQCHQKIQFTRAVSTLQNNPHIHVFPSTSTTHTHILSLLPTDPPNPNLALGTTTTLPPTPSSFTTNPNFLTLLHETLREHAHACPNVQASAATYASQRGSITFSAHKPQGTAVDRSGSGAGGANTQGGVGGGGVGGWVHICDLRNPTPFGRVGDPGDIVGSMEVDARGHVIRGAYESCNAYRVVTNEGILGLSDYLRGKLVERLREEERRK